MANDGGKSGDRAQTDHALARAAAAGDRAALEALLARHRPFIHNLALRMLWDARDAEDATQEVLVKIATRLSSFRGESAIRTWVWRVAANHLLSRRRGRVEQVVHDFDCYGKALAALADEEEPGPEQRLLVEEAKIGCTVGMLLCLEREQRLAFVLGEIFGATDTEGAEALGMTREGFRQRLSRARRQLVAFLTGRCSLVDPANPCRCARKTRAFVRAGIVDPARLQFTIAHRARVDAVAPARADALDRTAAFAHLWREHPFYDAPGLGLALGPLVEDPTFSPAPR
ncbi:MAG TPA: sigma-70 family RNA polymerase sigma factor [Anaeromyxobacteraceae bacterium]|nr:sigma-70 family RNA polymerase sigma factor [Anaeromyxobacteraceae bacterium]